MQSVLVHNDWAQLLKLSTPNTGMAVSSDIGEADKIHPKNKQEVGRRLALNALNLVYDQDVVYSGPIFKSMQVEGDKIRLIFDHVGGGLTTKEGDKLTDYSIAGSNKIFHWADAKIDGETVVVHSDKIPNPVSARYAWAINPICNLYNKAGLPASCAYSFAHPRKKMIILHMNCNLFKLKLGYIECIFRG